MNITEKFSDIANSQHPRYVPQSQFLQLVRSIDAPIKRELRAFARTVWFKERMLNLLPGRQYRLRKNIYPDQATWWIEKDIPPFDLYRCIAYRIELKRAPDGTVFLVLQTGSRQYPIDLDDLSTLHDNLCRASNDPAMIIHRKMGAVLET